MKVGRPTFWALQSRQESQTIILMIIDEEAKVLFNFLVHPFRLAICLRVVSSGQVTRDTQEGVEILHELRCVLGTPITDDLSWEAVLAPHLVAVNLRHSQGRQLLICGDQDDHFRESVHNDQYHVMAV